MRKLIVPLIFLSIFGGLFYTRLVHPTEGYQFGVPIPDGFESIGIDISHHQGEINWDTLQSLVHHSKHIQFVYLKATEGLQHVDRQWEKNQAACKRYTIKYGAYHFFLPSKSGKEQAIHFLKHYHFKPGDLPPVLDIELESQHDFKENIREWLSYIEENTGVRPVIYTSRDFYRRYFQQDFQNYKFWVASYSRNPGLGEDPRIIHWQFTEKAVLPGLSGYFDMNVSRKKY